MSLPMNFVPPSIVLPEWIDRENLRWRCDNYHGY